MPTLPEQILSNPVHDRLRDHTPAHLNEKIDEETRIRIDYYSRRGAESIQRRLAELDREWDVDRALMLNLSIAAGLFTSLGLLRSRRYLLLPLIQLGFLYNHATKGWCPPVSLLRRLGYRTQQEISRERDALLAAMATAKEPVEESLSMAQE